MKNPCANCKDAKHFVIGKTKTRHCHYCTASTVCDKYIKYRELLQSKRKYEQGEPISNINELLEQEFVYVFGGIRHIEVVKHLQLATIISMIFGKRIYKAIKKVEVMNNVK